MPELISPAPELLPLGLTELTWTARDKGPNPPSDTRDYAPTAIQRIIVRDTQPPILLAPPSKVIEASGDVPLIAAAIGDAAAVDLVDVQPTDRQRRAGVVSAGSAHARAVERDGSSATRPWRRSKSP